MTKLRALFAPVRRGRMLAAALLLTATAGFGVTTQAHAAGAAKTGRVLLDEELAKLSVVVMANQTAISSEEAAAVLPLLTQIGAKSDAARQSRSQLDDTTSADLRTGLRAAMTTKLRAAVDAVRLLTATRPSGPPPGADAGGAPPDGAGFPGGGGGPGGPGGEGGPGGRGLGGPGGPGGGLSGLMLLNALTIFFKTAAAG